MFLTELFENKQLNELDPDFVNTQIEKQKQSNNKPAWKLAGQGATASVWEHYSDPNTVVKVVGGGDYESFDTERNITLAFVHFLVDHGHLSKHFPIVHGINIDDNQVLQIRIEKLFPLQSEVSYSLENIVSEVIMNGGFFSDSAVEDLEYNLRKFKLSQKNNVKEIAEAIRLLKRAISVYGKAHGILDYRVDLHSGNWLRRADGTIVAADPWYADEEDNTSGDSWNSWGSDFNES